MGVIDFVQAFKKVEDCTSGKDDPPPGALAGFQSEPTTFNLCLKLPCCRPLVYLMDEIAELASSSPDAAEKVADRIAKRLTNKSVNTKYKALRLIKHLCSKGCSSFQRTMQRHAALVR
jgi:hypothetical protein